MDLLVELYTKTGREPFNIDMFVADVGGVSEALGEIDCDIRNYNARKVHKAVYYLMDNDGTMTDFKVSYKSDSYKLVPDILEIEL